MTTKPRRSRTVITRDGEHVHWWTLAGFRADGMTASVPAPASRHDRMSRPISGMRVHEQVPFAQGA